MEPRKILDIRSFEFWFFWFFIPFFSFLCFTTVFAQEVGFDSIGISNMTSEQYVTISVSPPYVSIMYTAYCSEYSGDNQFWVFGSMHVDNALYPSGESLTLITSGSTAVPAIMELDLSLPDYGKYNSYVVNAECIDPIDFYSHRVNVVINRKDIVEGQFATSSQETTAINSLSFGVAVLIMLGFLMVSGFVYNGLKIK